MNKIIITISSLFMLLTLILSVGFTQHKAKASSPNDQYIPITINDLSSVGYTGITQQQPESDKYQSSSGLYFWVNGASEYNTMTGNTFDLLMVAQYTNDTLYNYDLFNYGTSTHSVNINGARAQEAQLDYNRVALDFAKGNYYVTIIGTDFQKVEALADLIAKKI
jgi:hypothetical protein